MTPPTGDGIDDIDYALLGLEYDDGSEYHTFDYDYGPVFDVAPEPNPVTQPPSRRPQAHVGGLGLPQVATTPAGAAGGRGTHANQTGLAGLGGLPDALGISHGLWYAIIGSVSALGTICVSVVSFLLLRKCCECCRKRRLRKRATAASNCLGAGGASLLPLPRSNSTLLRMSKANAVASLHSPSAFPLLPPDKALVNPAHYATPEGTLPLDPRWPVSSTLPAGAGAPSTLHNGQHTLSGSQNGGHVYLNEHSQFLSPEHMLGQADVFSGISDPDDPTYTHWASLAYSATSPPSQRGPPVPPPRSLASDHQQQPVTAIELQALSSASQRSAAGVIDPIMIQSQLPQSFYQPPLSCSANASAAPAPSFTNQKLKLDRSNASNSSRTNLNNSRVFSSSSLYSN